MCFNIRKREKYKKDKTQENLRVIIDEADPESLFEYEEELGNDE